MTLHKSLHPRDDVDSLYVSIKEAERGLSSTEDSVDASIQWLKNYIEMRGGRRITVTRDNTDNARINWKEIPSN